MSRLLRPECLMRWPLLAMVLLSSGGCSGPARLHGNAVAADLYSSPANHRSGSGQETVLVAKESASSRNSENLPAGTLITVRLRAALVAENPGSQNLETSGTFEAFVDEPVVVEGINIVPRGSAVAGRVESAQASSMRIGQGYIRLALESIRVSGADLPVQTSSLFVRGVAAESHLASHEVAAGPGALHDVTESQVIPRQTSAGAVRLEKGRRLTFRLNEAVSITHSPATDSSRAQVDR